MANPFARLKSWWSGTPATRPLVYEGGRIARSDPDFTPMAIGPNALADLNLDLARRRCRWLGRNHPLIVAAKRTFIANVVGDEGVMVMPDTRWPELNKKLRDLWYAWEEACDVARGRTMAMVQADFAAECFDGGDCLVYLPFADAFGGNPAGPAVELLGAEHLDQGVNTFGLGARGTSSSGNRIRQGVEFDAKGRPVAYHVYAEHPSDGWMAQTPADLRRIRAEDATLGSFTRGNKMVRGIPMAIAAIMTARMQDGYEESHLMLARAAACVGLYLKGANVSTLMKRGANEAAMGWATDAQGRPITRLEPGMVGGGPSTIEPTLLTPTMPGPQFETVQRILAQHMASAVAGSYSDITGDYADATFSSERARALAVRKGYKPAQKLVNHYTNRPTYRRFVDFTIAQGLADDVLTAEMRAAWIADRRGFYRFNPIYGGWEWVNPQQESAAAQIELSIGTRSVVEICAGRGRHYEDVIREQIAAEIFEREERKKAGLEPRKPAPPPGAGGAAQPSDEKPQDPNKPTEGDLSPRQLRDRRVAALNGAAHE